MPACCIPAAARHAAACCGGGGLRRALERPHPRRDGAQPRRRRAADRRDCRSSARRHDACLRCSRRPAGGGRWARGAMTNDPKDRHVLAAAVVGRADVVVTLNLRDFPLNACRAVGVEPVHPDDFLLDAYDEAPAPVFAAVERQAADSSARRRRSTSCSTAWRSAPRGSPRRCAGTAMPIVRAPTAPPRSRRPRRPAAGHRRRPPRVTAASPAEAVPVRASPAGKATRR